jgi:hypothetical protein
MPCGERELRLGMPQRDEESLIDDMRATIRADRERAAARTPKPVDPPAPVAPPAVEPGKSMLRRLLGR